MQTLELLKLPKGWATSRLEDISLSIVGGGTPSRKHDEYFGGDIVWLTPTEVPKEKITVVSDSKEKITKEGFENSSVRLVPAGSVLLTSRASIGHVAIAGCELTTNQGFASFVCSDAIYNVYLAYWLWSNKRILEQKAGGTTFKEISKAKLREMLIPLPPLNEQKRIVSKIEELFTKLDAGIEYLKKARIELKRYRQSVLKAAFEGRLTEEWRRKHEDDIEPISQLLERIHSTRSETNRRKETSEGGSRRFFQLPNQWGWTTIGEIAEVIQYGTSEKANIDDSGIPVLRMGNIREGKIDFQNLRFMPTKSPQLRNFILDDGDLLFNRTNSKELVGKSAVYRSSYPKAAFASYLIRVKTNRRFYDPDILSYFINSNFGRLYINSVVSQQVGQANVNGTKLSAMPIPLFSVQEQEVLLSELQRSLSIADQTEKTIEYITHVGNRLRQSILNQAFQGKLLRQDPNDESAEKLIQRIGEDRRFSVLPRQFMIQSGKN